MGTKRRAPDRLGQSDMHSRAFVSVIGQLPLLLVAAAFTLHLSGRPAVAGERTADISPEVVLRHGLLTVHATDMPLTELPLHIQRQTFGKAGLTGSL